jgi:hypothetical protein
MASSMQPVQFARARARASRVGGEVSISANKSHKEALTRPSLLTLEKEAGQLMPIEVIREC